MKILFIASHAHSFINFRGDLIREISKKHSVVCCGPFVDSEQISMVESLGASYSCINIKRNQINIFSDFKYLFGLIKLIRREKPDKVIAYTIKPVIFTGIASYFSPFFHFYPMITGLGYIFNINKRFNIVKALTIILYKISLKKSHKVVFQNPDNQTYFHELGLIKYEKSELILGSGVNLQHYSKSSLPSEPVFLMIARLLYDKGIIEYLKAAKLIKKDYPHVRFILVGPYENSNNGLCKTVLEQFNDIEQVDYLGVTDDVRSHLKNCSIFVLPSYHEGLPRSVLEAMAAGRPVLTTDVPGCRETVINGENGWLVKKANVEQLVDRMKWFIENPLEWHRMAMASRDMVENKFDVHKINTQLSNIMGLNK